VAQSPIPEDIIINKGYTIFGISDADLPESLEKALLQSDDQGAPKIEHRLKDERWKPKCQSPELEPQVKRLVAAMTPRQREVAKRVIAVEILEDEELARMCNWNLHFPPNTYHYICNKFFAKLRAIVEPADIPLLLDLLKTLFSETQDHRTLVALPPVTPADCNHG